MLFSVYEGDCRRKEFVRIEIFEKVILVSIREEGSREFCFCF